MSDKTGRPTKDQLARDAKESAAQAAARDTIDILHEISSLLNTGLDKHTLSLCVTLCENGVNPEALAEVVRELRIEAAGRKWAFKQKVGPAGLHQ